MEATVAAKPAEKVITLSGVKDMAQALLDNISSPTPNLRISHQVKTLTDALEEVTLGKEPWDYTLSRDAARIDLVRSGWLSPASFEGAYSMKEYGKAAFHLLESEFHVFSATNQPSPKLQELAESFILGEFRTALEGFVRS